MPNFFTHIRFFLVFFFFGRLLQISSFNGKMNALNEVNKLIANVTYNLHKHGQGELDEWLTTDKVAVSCT